MPNFQKLNIKLNNGRPVVLDYLPHRRIEFSLFGFRVKVCKPYGSSTLGSGIYNVDPVIEFSSSSTIFTDLLRLHEIESCIKKCIELLDNEKDGLLIGSANFSMKNSNTGKFEECYEDDLPLHVKELHEIGKVKTKALRMEDLKHNKIYEDVRGKHWIYWGNGSLYSKYYSQFDRDACKENRQGCSLVYINYDEIVDNGGYEIDSNGSLITYRSSLIVDTYASKKRFVKEVGEVNWACRQIISKLSESNLKVFRLGDKNFVGLGNIIYRNGGNL